MYLYNYNLSLYSELHQIYKHCVNYITKYTNAANCTVYDTNVMHELYSELYKHYKLYNKLYKIVKYIENYTNIAQIV